MRAFPIFLSLAGARAIVCGGTPAATRKIDLLLAASARVELIADELCEELYRMVLERRIVWRGDTLNTVALDGAAIVIAADTRERRNADASAMARARGLPVNVVD